MIRNLTSEDVRAIFGFGVAVWLVATIVFRFGGQVLLDPDSPLIIAGVFLAAVPAMVILTFAVFVWREIRPAARPAAAILLVAPGMLIDAILLPLFDLTFPNMARASAGYLAGLAMLAYLVVLLVGLFSKSR
jgi:hypothetical protein